MFETLGPLLKLLKEKIKLSLLKSDAKFWWQNLQRHTDPLDIYEKFDRMQKLLKVSIQIQILQQNNQQAKKSFPINRNQINTLDTRTPSVVQAFGFDKEFAKCG